MRFRVHALVGVFASAALMSVAHAQVVTQSSTNNIVDGNSVACNTGGVTDENSYYRAFDLSTFGISGAWQVSSAMFGVELAASSTGLETTQNVTVNLYDNYNISGSSLNITGALVGSTTVTVNDGSDFLQNVSISGVVTTGHLVMEVFVPDSSSNGDNLGNEFFIGSNTDAETGPDFIRAPACSVTSPTDLSSIGFPDMHMVMAVTGSPVPEPATLTALGLGALALIRKRNKK